MPEKSGSQTPSRLQLSVLVDLGELECLISDDDRPVGHIGARMLSIRTDRVLRGGGRRLGVLGGLRGRGRVGPRVAGLSLRTGISTVSVRPQRPTGRSLAARARLGDAVSSTQTAKLVDVQRERFAVCRYETIVLLEVNDGSDICCSRDDVYQESTCAERNESGTTLG